MAASNTPDVAAMIRRPTSAKPEARAVETFAAPAPTPSGTESAQAPRVRATIVYPPKLLRSLKVRAVREGTTLGDLSRAAIASALADPEALVTAARGYARATGARTGLDLPASQHRQLKMLAAEHGVTVQALMMTAIAPPPAPDQG